MLLKFQASIEILNFSNQLFILNQKLIKLTQKLSFKIYKTSVRNLLSNYPQISIMTSLNNQLFGPFKKICLTYRLVGINFE